MNKLKILLVTYILSFLTMTYLTVHHYQLKIGNLSEKSVCQVSQTINCNAAASSSYSEFFGIPLALIGAVYSLIAIIMLLVAIKDWIQSISAFKTYFKALTALSLLLSLFLAYVTVSQIKVLCPFCLIGYLFSGIQFVIVWFLLEKEKFNMPAAFQHKNLLYSWLSVPVFSWLIAASINQSYGFSEIAKMIPEKIFQWTQMPSHQFNLELGLIKGNMNGTKVIVEFADFKCPHCKSAASTAKKALQIDPSVKVIFKPFPLDGQCNPHVQFKGDNSRCQMAALVICAEKIEQKGFALHDYFLENQEKLFQVTDVLKSIEDLKILSNFESVKACSTETETLLKITKMTDEAKAAGVEGTPTIFVNNKKLPLGQVFEVLKSALKTLQ